MRGVCLQMNVALSTEPNKTQRVTNYIEGEIRAGVLAPGARLESMRDLAKKFNVSYAVINSTYDVLEDKGMIVRIPRSGAIINPKLKPAKTKLVALITSYGRDTVENYYEPLFSVAASNRISTIVTFLAFEQNWRQAISDVINRQPDCLLIDLEARWFPLEELKQLTAAVPACYCNRWEWFPENPERAVLTDYAGAYGEALVFLRRHGHRRIIMLDHHLHPEPFLNRYLENAMKFAGLAFGENVLRIFEDQLIKDPDAVETELKGFKPTALFGLSDYLIHEIVEKCPSAKGLEKLGFYNLWYSRVPRRKFNTFSVDFGEMWKEAIGSFDNGNSQIRFIKPKLIIK